MKWCFMMVAGLGLMLGACRKAEEKGPAPTTPPGEGAEAAAPDASGEAPAPPPGEEAPPQEAEQSDGPPTPASSAAQFVQAFPGRPGFGVNPYTGMAIDMRGKPAGTIVRDARDPDPTHRFVVSREIEQAGQQASRQRAKERRPVNPQKGPPE